MASRCSNAMEKRQDTRLVNNYNDITHHFLYYIYVHSDLAKAKHICRMCQTHGGQTDEEKEAARKKVEEMDT